MIEISVVARCTQRNTPISPIKGIVGGVSRERALQAIRNDLIGMLFNNGFKQAPACRGPGACPCVCRRLQLAGGNRRRGRHEFGFHFCQICPARVGGFLAANWCQIESKMLRSSVSVFSDKRTYTSLKKSDEIALLITSECALTLHKLIVRVMCLKTVSEVATATT